MSQIDFASSFLKISSDKFLGRNNSPSSIENFPNSVYAMIFFEYALKHERDFNYSLI